ncbi:hypothetical protein HDU97_004472 [Phlyctochytrium planicorne]|nr:hypothetical protein HDU97_004472 [Phlyctochytrium planicorne]
MTRTRRTSSGNLTFDRHLQRNGGDVKVTTKKNGYGSYNWGSFEDFDLDYELSRSPDSKIKILDESQFKAVKEMAYSSSP